MANERTYQSPAERVPHPPPLGLRLRRRPPHHPHRRRPHIPVSVTSPWWNEILEGIFRLCGWKSIAGTVAICYKTLLHTRFFKFG